MKFAGLDNEILAAAAPGRAADEVQLAANVNRRVLAGGQKCLREHRGGRGFAVSTGNADDLGRVACLSFEFFQLTGKKLDLSNDSNTAVLCFFHCRRKD